MYLSILISLLLGLMVSCVGQQTELKFKVGDISKEPPMDPLWEGKKIPFSSIQSILSNSCLSCHHSGSSGRQYNFVNLKTEQDWINSAYIATSYQSGKRAEYSLLYNSLQGSTGNFGSKTMPVGTPLSGKDRLLIKQWIEGLPAATTSGPVQNLTLLSPQNNQNFSLDQISINGKCDGAESVLVSGDIIGNVQTACYNNTFVTSARLTPGNGVKNLVLSQINSAGQEKTVPLTVRLTLATEINRFAEAKAVMSNKCINCHTGYHTNLIGLNEKEFVNLTPSTTTNYRMIVPGNALDSWLVKKIKNTNYHFQAGDSGSKMPLNGTLTNTEYLKIVDWINHLELDEEEISFSVTDNLANIIKDSQPIPVNMGSESKDYSPIFKSFKIANTSVVGELHLRDLEVSAQNFSIHETFSKAKLLPGESAVFIIKLNTNVAGNFTSQVTFKTNSNTQGSFSFSIQGSVTSQAACSDEQIDNRDIQLLSSIELKNSILDLLDVESSPELYLPSDEAIRGKVYGVPRATQNYVLFYTTYAEKVAKAFVYNDGSISGMTRKSTRALAGCNPDSPGSNKTTCAQNVINYIVPRALGDKAPANYTMVYTELFNSLLTETSDFKVALQGVVFAIIGSGEFIFLVEKNNTAQATFNLSNDELARRLSIVLWRSKIPSEWLIARVTSNTLRNNLEAVIDDMLADEKARRGILDGYFRSWFRKENFMEQVNPAAEHLPAGVASSTIKDDLWKEIERTFEYIVENNKPIEDVILADYTFVNKNLAQFYDYNGTFSTSFKKHTRPQASAGLIESAGPLMQYSASNIPGKEPLTPRRGAWIVDEFLCDEAIHNLPADIPVFQPRPEGLSIREQFELHSSSPACAGCHQIIDPIGFGLAGYSSLGLPRSKDAINRPVDTKGLLYSQAFHNPAQMAQILSQKSAFRACVVQKFFTYALAEPKTPSSQCTINKVAMKTKVVDKNNLQFVMKEILTSDKFTKRSRMPAN